MDITSENYLQPELEHDFIFEDDFSIDTKEVFQDLHQLDNLCHTSSSFNTKEVFQDLPQLDNLSHTSASFNTNYTTDVVGYDPFDLGPYHSSSNDIDLYEFKHLHQVNDSGMMVNFNNQNKHRTSWTHVDPPTRLGLIESPILDPKPMSFFIVDEISHASTDNRIKKVVSKNRKGKTKTNSSKGQWTKEEDRVLKEMVEKHGVRRWSYIAQVLEGRVGKQCRERWHNHLRPDIKKDFWSEEEDRILIEAHAEVGNKWSEIAKRLPGRTENSTKNHWNATKRRQYTKRKCRTKWPKPNLILQNYIRSLNLPRGRVNSNRAHSLMPVEVEDPEYFDLCDVPELAMDEKLLEWDENIESLLCSSNDGDDDDVDHLMEMISHSDL